MKTLTILEELRSNFGKPRYNKSVEELQAMLHEFGTAKMWQWVLDEAGWASLNKNYTRSFGVASANKLRPAHNETIEFSDIPPTEEMLLSLVADPKGVAEAERLAFEISARLVAWRGVIPTSVEWILYPRLPPRQLNFGAPWTCARYSAETAIEVETGEDPAKETTGLRAPFWAKETASGMASWVKAVELDAFVTTHHWPPKAIKFKPFRELDNPFEPAVLLSKTGYLPSAELTAEEPVLRLYMPSVLSNV